jgi:hypothetical protein
MIPYLLQAGLFLAASLCFYKLLLQQETFYRVNRWLLLACIATAFFLPLVPVPPSWSWQKASPVVVYDSGPVMQYTPAPVEKAMVKETPIEPVKASAFTIANGLKWGAYLYWFGVAAFALNFLIQLVVLWRRIRSYPIIADGRYRIVEVTGDKAPCSFGNYIFINPEKYDWDTYTQILTHEKIHVAQRHTLDLLLTELMLVFQWFNPFAWAYRKTVENNLEFLTDQTLITQPEMEKTAYQLSLLKVSAPHFPLSLTTNYNQSLLKKRVIMMNAKRSSINATWKYLFLLPVFVGAMCLLNEPVAYGQTANTQEAAKAPLENGIMATEGQWFADIRTSGVQFQFQKDGYTGNGTNGTIFSLKELGSLPQGKEGAFSLTREAGTIEFTGRFDGDKGMGRYRFVPNTAYRQQLQKEGIDLNNDLDQMTFFFVNATYAYVKELKAMGYTSIRKSDLVPLSALDVNAAYILSIKEAGFKNIRLNDLIAFRSLKIDDQYIQGLRKAGYPTITPEKVIQFKAAGLDQQAIEEIRPLMPSKKETTEGATASTPAHVEQPQSGALFNTKTDLGDFEAYSRSLKEVGFDNIPIDKLVELKRLGITADHIRQWQASGLSYVRASDLMGLKATNVSPEFIAGFRAVGFTNISPGNAMGLKSLGITPELVKEYQDLGFTNITIGNLMGAKATGVTPQFIKNMRAKGHNLTISKYIAFRSALSDGTP